MKYERKKGVSGGTDLIRILCAVIRTRLARLREQGDAGYTTETVVVIALLVAMALAVLAIITAKVIGKANSLNFG